MSLSLTDESKKYLVKSIFQRLIKIQNVFHVVKMGKPLFVIEGNARVAPRRSHCDVTASI